MPQWTIYPNHPGAPASVDTLLLCDISDTTDSPDGTVKEIAVVDLVTPVTTSRSLGDGMGTITLSTTRFELTGTAVGPFTLTIADGTAIGRLVRIVVTGDPGAHTIDLRDQAAVVVVGKIVKDVIYWVIWSGTTWIRDETNRRRDLPLISPILTADVTGLDTALAGKQPLDA